MAFIFIFNGYTYYEVHEYYFEHYFPGLCDMIDEQNCISLYAVADHIRTFIPNFKRKALLNKLKQLFGLFKNSNFDSIGYRIRRHLDQVFTPVVLSYRQGLSLSRSRSTYAVLAALCQVAESPQLAEILLDVFWQHRREVANQERSGRIIEWITAFESLRGYGEDHVINKCIQYLMQKAGNSLDYGRGRPFLRPSLYPPGIPRSRTMPPAVYRHRLSPHPGFLALPSPDPMYHSLPSPAHSVGFIDTHRDAEMEEMRMEHEELAQRVGELEWNQAEFNAAMRLPMHNQLQPMGAY